MVESVREITDRCAATGLPLRIAFAISSRKLAFPAQRTDPEGRRPVGRDGVAADRGAIPDDHHHLTRLRKRTHPGLNRRRICPPGTTRRRRGERTDRFVIEAFPNETVQVEFDDDWSERRPGGRRHRGSDIKSPKGTHVVAVADGIVEEMKWHRAGGWSIEITHAAGWSTHYLHLNDDSPGTNDGSGGEETAFAEGLEEGSFVRSGQVIGFVGDSGNAEVPHNHFEIHRDGTKVNPFPYLEAAWARKLSAYDKRGFIL